MFRTPTPTDTARDVVTNPNDFHDQPSVRAIAWAILMEARGKRCDLDRMGIPAGPLTLKESNEESLRAARVAQRVRDHAESQGYTLRDSGPTDGDAA